MKILLIHHRIPFPLHSGMDKVRYNLIRILASRYEVSLIAPIDGNTNEDDIKHVSDIVHELITLPVENMIQRINRSRLLYLRRLISCVFSKVPIYITNSFYSEFGHLVREQTHKKKFHIAQPLSDVTGVYLDYIVNNTYKVLGPLDDTIKSALTDMKVETNLLKKIVWYFEYRARKDWQPKYCKKSDRVFFFSTADLNNIQKQAKGLNHARTLPVVVEPDDKWIQKQSKIEKSSILFVGGLGSLFNQNAVLFFHKKIFHLIKKSIPDAKFYIVGHHPPASIQKIGRMEDVIVTGEVPSVHPYIEKAAVYVSPIIAGTGLKTKVIEALRFGKAIVSTQAGIQGLWDLSKDAITIRDDPEGFAEQVIKLLQDETLRRQKEINARTLYEKSYQFDRVVPLVLARYKEIEKEIIKQ